MGQRRFFRILHGQRGAAAKAKYLSHLEGLGTGSAIATRGNRPESVTLYVYPFTVTLGSELVLQTSAWVPSFEALKGGMGRGRVLSALPLGRLPIKIRKGAAARVAAMSGLAPSGVVKTSKLTGLKYADYGGVTYSCPFGRGTSSESQAAAFSAIKSNLSPTFKRIHLLRERL